MDYTNTDFWITLVLCGGIVAAMSAVQQTMSKNPNEPYSKFNIRPVIRDFCLGGFLGALLFMFFPESISSWLSFSTNSIESVSKSVTSSLAKVSSQASDIELQFGPARF